MKNNYWVQREGLWLGPEGLGFLGYAGSVAGRNDPDKQYVVSTGPLPQGWYTLSELKDPNGSKYGPGYIGLEPDKANKMGGRWGFLVHWDKAGSDGIGAAPDVASEGCVIPYDGQNIRRILARASRRLQVVRGMEELVMAMRANGDYK